MRLAGLFLTVLLISFQTVYAKEEPVFNLTRAAVTLKSAQALLANKYIPFERLVSERNSLSKMIDGAKACSLRQEGKLDNINKIKLSLGINADKALAGAESADVVYIKERAKVVVKRLGDCRLYQLKADVVLTEYLDRLAVGAKKRMWEKGLPIWSLLAKTIKGELNFFDSQHFINLEKLSVLSLFEFAYVAMMTLVSFLIFRFAFTKYAKRVTVSYVLLSIVSVSLSVTSLLLYTLPDISLTKLSVIILLYTSLLLVISVISRTYLFTNFAHSVGLSALYLKRAMVLSIYFFLAYQALSIIIHWQSLPEDMYDLLKMLFSAVIYTVFFVTYGSFISQVNKETLIRRYEYLINGFIYTVLLIGFVMNLLGYEVIASYVAINSIISLIYIGLLALLYRILNQAYQSIMDRKTVVYQFAYQRLGVDSRKSTFEITTIFHLMVASILMMFVYKIVGLWDLSGVTDTRLYDWIIDGFVFLNIRIIPLDLITGLLVFCFLNIIIRIFLSRFTRGTGKKSVFVGNRSGIAQLIYYVGSSISLVIALFVAGISLTGLAIVAGALSVGIGLGLKSIVNNFIAGIILLIEKPIKIGDFITINDVTGTVKRIGARSTHIETRRRVEVIVPNEDLIVNQVSNFMFERPVLRIECPVGVAYGTDLKLVEKLLLQAAAENPRVISGDPKRMPRVLLLEFGNSSINFELRAVITEVPDRNIIRSELFFAINELFKAHHIEIPFPQIVQHRASKD